MCNALIPDQDIDLAADICGRHCIVFLLMIRRHIPDEGPAESGAGGGQIDTQAHPQGHRACSCLQRNQGTAFLVFSLLQSRQEMQCLSLIKARKHRFPIHTAEWLWSHLPPAMADTDHGARVAMQCQRLLPSSPGISGFLSILHPNRGHNQAAVQHLHIFIPDRTSES